MSDRPDIPRFTVVHVTPEMEAAATARARQAAADSERSAAWFAAQTPPDMDSVKLRERLERAHTEAATLSGQIGDLKRELADAEAKLTRVRALAARIRQGAPWTANDDDIADHILRALDGDQTPGDTATPPPGS